MAVDSAETACGKNEGSLCEAGRVLIKTESQRPLTDKGGIRIWNWETGLLRICSGHPVGLAWSSWFAHDLAEFKSSCYC